MANRPVFIPMLDGKRLVLERPVEFHWFPGFAKSQKQKSIRDLHSAARTQLGIKNPLEISSKSEDPLGMALSSFNLSFTTKKGRTLSVECAFQGSKVFELGGPFRDLFDKSSLEAKRDQRLKNSGSLKKFTFFGEDWALLPRTAFYDWLYINALVKDIALSERATEVDCFTDIEFNPDRSINCQARSAALFCALYHTDQLDFALASKTNFLSLYAGKISAPFELSMKNRLL